MKWIMATPGKDTGIGWHARFGYKADRQIKVERCSQGNSIQVLITSGCRGWEGNDGGRIRDGGRIKAD
ncbi:hypothetical protein LCGC14_2714770 [marine sediment metagenome]|uniref:Uncharacterized protein n=1 Tax=marine sediment metagenome TaxID=412755 RepID=A0A0F9C3K3_9ZZZZ